MATDLPEKAARKIRELERAGRLTEFLSDLRPRVLKAIVRDGPSEAEEKILRLLKTHPQPEFEILNTANAYHRGLAESFRRTLERLLAEHKIVVKSQTRGVSSLQSPGCQIKRARVFEDRAPEGSCIMLKLSNCRLCRAGRKY
jgi:hypothetical protein